MILGMRPNFYISLFLAPAYLAIGLAKLGYFLACAIGRGLMAAADSAARKLDA